MPLNSNEPGFVRDLSASATSRRSVLGGLAGLAAGALTVGTAAAAERDPEAVPTPDVEGPVQGGIRTGEPENAAPRDLSQWGYVEEEYFISGEAMALRPGDSQGSTAEYKTRMIVHRPADMDGSSSGPPFGRGRGVAGRNGGFSGTVVVNWPNVTLQRDNPVAIMNTHEYLMEQGHVGVVFSAQKQGVDGSPLAFRWWDPVRYADIHHPGDEYSFDMLSQALKLLKDGPGDGYGQVDPLQGHRAEQVYPTGVSQSAGMLLDYINDVQALHGIADGFMPFHTSSTPTERDGVRDDLVPVLWINSEDESDERRREDAGLFKLWEVAGDSHVNYYTSAWAGAVQRRDHGTVAGIGVDREWDEEDAGQYGEIGSGPCARGNFSPARYALTAGIRNLHEWVTRNREPPTAPRIERDESGEVRTDEHGNALGGYRLPTMDVPVAEYQARSCQGAVNSSFGQTLQFRTAKLRELYPTHDDYIDELEAVVEDAIDDEFLVEWAANDLLRRARRSDIPEGELP